MSYRQGHRSTTDSEILWSGLATVGAGVIGIVFLVIGNTFIGTVLLAVLFVGFGRALCGNLLWRDLD